MNLLLQRDPFLPTGTLGSLAVNGSPFCATLEPPDAQFKPVFACIPAGIYNVTLYDSHRFNRPMPLLNGVPNRSYIEMHWGNYVQDTDGCILVGQSKSISGDNLPAIWNTRDAFDKLFPLISDAQREGVTIEVRNWVPVVSDPELGM